MLTPVPALSASQYHRIKAAGTQRSFSFLEVQHVRWSPSVLTLVWITSASSHESGRAEV
jgi:hypothetical protein